MEKKVLFYQSTVCCILGFALLCSIFMPRYALTTRVGDTMAQCVRAYGSIQGGAFGKAISSEADNYKKMVKEMISEFEEKGIPTKYSTFSVAVSSPRTMIEKLGMDDEDDEGLSAFLGYWNIVRVYAWLLFGVAAGLFFAAVEERRRKENAGRTTLFVWGAVVLNVFYVFAVQFLAAGKLDATSGAGMDLSVKFARRMLWSFHSTGFYVSMVVTVLLVFWLLWRYMSMGRLTGLKHVLAKVMDVNKYIGGTEGQSIQPGGGYIPPTDNRTPVDYQVNPSTYSHSGSVCAVRGMFSGATIPCKPGEQISIGREANLCQIVIASPGVDPKHGTISYDDQRNVYTVTCYSNAGMQITGYGNLMAQQSVQVQPGTHLAIAETEEFELR